MLVSGAIIRDVLRVFPPVGGLRLPKFRHLHTIFHAKNFISGGFIKSCPSFCYPKLYNGLHNGRPRDFPVRASADSSDNDAPVAPLEFESPVGQFLAEILQTNPHLFPEAIDNELQKLQIERDAQKEASSTSSQYILDKRIAEIKEKERRMALEEIIYCFIVYKFVENEISMIPKISATSDPTRRLDFWRKQKQKLESVHSPEAFVLIERNLSCIHQIVGTIEPIVQVRKIRLGMLYSALVEMGYFLKRVDEPFQVQKTMKTGEAKSFRLQAYVNGSDAETFQKYDTMRSNEAISLVERQTQSLFGKCSIEISKDGFIRIRNEEVIFITSVGFTVLLLEAVAFGSFLWEAENYAEFKYHFVDG